ncbi:protein prenyltransferase alpha subunit repeat-containing protein 1 [Musca domestica]|uniref:Protein prenyltransferase alpha subunit repeat-containing protein 1 n=2 Tax=Musca domestica TaxID=7370 RepID=A0ABM3UY55_MUSDO|nr:protein prenyltransferase alpha subunit repeat-containing protein 1 [Musca domestica]XP_058978465.1 protein prenyltransferase alpha subunit repeat-containing protein 1 [Musca domestica]XP_058978466.1 protein prenyltransferase alpha subunit repeat-containing protein 1 [Musca domestica]XP_058978467.1 protein prenyltransferase alpha subunit repeat-containing protein 1 [Musca domestica]
MDSDSDNEHTVLCEKIINDMHTVFLKDTELSSFEIIPTVLNRNKSPVIHVEHNLGLESWCAKHVYDHAHRMLMGYKKQTVQRYVQQSEQLLKYLNVALLINPDVTAFWHIRRQLVQKNRLKMNRELKFSTLVLSKKPKSNEAFAYRRWLYSFQSNDAIDWHHEIGICERCADRSSSNYHAWSHRQWVLHNAPMLIRAEIMRSEKFMRKHISDYSSYHYRQILITFAYQMSFYETDQLHQLHDLKQLINYYLIAEVQCPAQILNIMLPGVDQAAIGEARLKSFLYCCNLAAHDMRLCDDQKNMYGERESFELHRRASLKFIVEQCVRLLSGDLMGIYSPPATPVQQQQFNTHLRKFDYNSYEFLRALKKSESLLGSKHRKWCSLFLGFDFESGAA